MKLPPYKIDRTVLGRIFFESTISDTGDTIIPWYPDVNEIDNIAPGLFEELSNIDDSQKLRVKFTFYDENIMNSVKIENYTFRTLYDEFLNNIHLPWTINNRIFDYEINYNISAIEEYKNCKNAYECLTKIVEPSWQKEFPQIFATEESYNDYLQSPSFTTQYPQLSRMKEIEQELKEIEQDPEFRTNQTLMNRALMLQEEFYNLPTQAPYPIEQSKFYKILACKLAPKISEALFNHVKSDFNLENLTHSDYRFAPCGEMTATMTKAEILELSKADQRFYFLSIGLYVRPEGYSNKISDALALYMASNQGKDVYNVLIKIDDKTAENKRLWLNGIKITESMNWQLKDPDYIKEWKFTDKKVGWYGDLWEIPNNCYKVPLKMTQILRIADNDAVLYMDIWI